MGYSPWSHKESDTAKNEEGGKLNFMVLSGFDEVKMKWGRLWFHLLYAGLWHFKRLLEARLLLP